MIEFLDKSVEQTILILLFSLSVAVFIAGLVIYKRRIFDQKNESAYYRDSDRRSPSKTIGRLMMVISGILGLVFFMVMLMSFAGI